ncbi:hypothetical protein, partial [Salmonella sp. hn-h4]|uniref:hypothetical protein n=1 Tax=Salmonella sp. hn-h4 TaxID=2582612 RepID=UPI001F30C2D7
VLVSADHVVIQGYTRGSSGSSVAQDMQAVFGELGKKFAYLRFLCYNITADKSEQVFSSFFA